MTYALRQRGKWLSVEPVQSTADSSTDSLAAKNLAADSVSATEATDTRSPFSILKSTGVMTSGADGSTGAENDSITTPSDAAMASMPSANTGIGCEFEPGIYVVSDGIARRIHDGAAPSVKRVGKWLCA